MAELKRLIEDTDFISTNKSLDDSDGPTNLTVYENPDFEIVAEELAPQIKLEKAAPDLLEALQAAYDFIENNVAYGTPKKLAKKIQAAIDLAKPAKA